MHTFAQLVRGSGGINMERGTGMKLELLHLTQGMWRVFFWRAFPILVPSPNFDTRGSEDDGKIWQLKGRQDLMTSFTCLWWHVDSVAADICPRGVFNQ